MGAVSNIVKAVVAPALDLAAGIVGIDTSPSQPQPQPQPAAAGESTSNASTTAEAAATEQPVNRKQAFGAKYASERAMAAKGGAGGAGGGGATLLTGPGGAQSGLELGQKTLLGG